MSRNQIAYTQPTSFDLNSVSIRPLLTDPASEYTIRAVADLSQVGDERARVPKACGLQVIESWYTACPLAAVTSLLNPRSGNPIPGVAAGAEPVLTGVCFSTNAAPFGPLSSDQVLDVQADLRPKEALSDEEVFKNEKVKAVMEKVVRATMPNKLATINVIMRATNSTKMIRDHMATLLAGAGEAATVTGRADDADASIVISAEQLDALSAMELTSFQASIASFDEKHQFEDYCIARLLQEGTPESFFLAASMGTLNRIVEDVRANASLASRSMDPELKKYLKAANYFYGSDTVVAFFRDLHPTECDGASDVEKKANREAAIDAGRGALRGHYFVGCPEQKLDTLWFNATVPASQLKELTRLGVRVMEIPVELTSQLAEFSYALLVSQMLTGTGATDAACALAGASAALCIRRGLYVDSEEVNRARNLDDLADGMVTEFTLARAQAVAEAFNDQIAVEITHVMRIHSFMKSGHHGTAAGLPHTGTKIAAALGNVRLSNLTVMLAEGPGAVYHMAHGASTRLSYLYYCDRAATTDLSYAISRRLCPPAPGTTAYILAKKFFDALSRGNFWRLLRLNDLHSAFNAAYATWHPNCHLEAPYAQYMYGVRAQPDEHFRAVSDDIMAYARQIQVIMPSSSMAKSVALHKVADAAANNDAVAYYHVSGYANALSTYTTRTVRSKMVTQSGMAIEE